MYAACVYPEASAGTTDAQGNPFCYLMNRYVRLGDPTQIFRDLKGTAKGERVILSDADGARFIERMAGRTMEEELIRAGFTEAQIKGSTTFNESEIIPWGNRQYRGLAFKYQNWRPEGIRKWQGNKNGDIGEYWELSWFIRDNFELGDMHPFDKLLDDHEKSSIVAAYGVQYGNRGFASDDANKRGWAECLVNLTGTFNGYGAYAGYNKGLYVAFPYTYLEAVGV